MYECHRAPYPAQHQLGPILISLYLLTVTACYKVNNIQYLLLILLSQYILVNTTHQVICETDYSYLLYSNIGMFATQQLA